MGRCKVAFTIICGLVVLGGLGYCGVCFILYPVFVPACPDMRCPCEGLVGDECINTQAFCEDLVVDLLVLVESKKSDDFVSYQIDAQEFQYHDLEERTLNFNFSSDHTYYTHHGEYVSKFYLNHEVSELYLEVKLPSASELYVYDSCFSGMASRCDCVLSFSKNDRFAFHLSNHTGYVYVIVGTKQSKPIQQKGWVKNMVFPVNKVPNLDNCSGTCSFSRNGKGKYTLVVDNVGYNINETTNYTIGYEDLNPDLFYNLLYGGGAAVGTVILYVCLCRCLVDLDKDDYKPRPGDTPREEKHELSEWEKREIKEAKREEKRKEREKWEKERRIKDLEEERARMDRYGQADPGDVRDWERRYYQEKYGDSDCVVM